MAKRRSHWFLDGGIWLLFFVLLVPAGIVGWAIGKELRLNRFRIIISRYTNPGVGLGSRYFGSWTSGLDWGMERPRILQASARATRARLRTRVRPRATRRSTPNVAVLTKVVAQGRCFTC